MLTGPKRWRRLSWRRRALVVMAWLALPATAVALAAFQGYRTLGDVGEAESGTTGVRVLFVGHTFTYLNGMPETLERIAREDRGAPRIFTVAFVAPNGSLQRAIREQKLSRLLREVRWDHVVLQERSRYAALPPQERSRLVDPFAVDLAGRAYARGARPVWFQTWGYRGGDERVPGDSYPAMQERVDRSAQVILRTVGGSIAPVGRAFAETRMRAPDLELWGGDGRQPSDAGSYLAACVLYAALTGRDPTGTGHTAGLSPGTARLLREVARDVVDVVGSADARGHSA